MRLAKAARQKAGRHGRSGSRLQRRFQGARRLEGKEPGRSVIRGMTFWGKSPLKGYPPGFHMGKVTHCHLGAQGKIDQPPTRNGLDLDPKRHPAKPAKPAPKHDTTKTAGEIPGLALMI